MRLMEGVSVEAIQEGGSWEGGGSRKTRQDGDEAYQGIGSGKGLELLLEAAGRRVGVSED